MKTIWVMTESVYGTACLTKEKLWIDIGGSTARDLQVILKTALGKIYGQTSKEWLGIETYDNSNILRFRNQFKNVKLRHIYFRQVSGDYYTKEIMLRFGMSRDSKCSRFREIIVSTILGILSFM